MFECICQFFPQYFHPGTGSSFSGYHWLLSGELNPYRVLYLNPETLIRYMADFVPNRLLLWLMPGGAFCICTCVSSLPLVYKVAYVSGRSSLRNFLPKP